MKTEKKAGKKKKNGTSDITELFGSLKGILKDLLAQVSIYDHDLNVIHRATHIIKTAVEEKRADH